MITIITGSSTMEPFKKYVIPLLKANQVEFQFQGLNKPFPPEGICLFMGGAAIDSIRGYEDEHKILTPKSLSIAKARMQTWHYSPGMDQDVRQIMFSYDPNIISIDPTKEPEIIWDVQKACRLEKTGSTEPEYGDYQWVTGKGLLAYILGLKKFILQTGTPAVASIDLETMGLQPFGTHESQWDRDDDGLIIIPEEKRILTISFTFNSGSAFVYKVPDDGQLGEDARLALTHLSNPAWFKLVGANLKFDIVWIAEKWGIWLGNQTIDTTIVGALLNENMSNSLNNHAKLFTKLGGYDDPFNLSWNKAHMEIPLEAKPEEFIKYAGGDTDACFRLYPIFKKKLLGDERLTRFYLRVLQPAAKVFAKMEQRGVCVDIEQYDAVEAAVRKDIKELHKQLLEHVPKRIQLKHREPDGSVKMKASVIKDLMFSPMGFDLTPILETPKGGVSTAKNHLAMFEDHPDAKDFIQQMNLYNQAQKTLTTYVVGFKKHLRADGMFHPSYNLARADYGRGDSGTVTGRTSTSDPAYQTIPKHTKYAKLLRSVFVTPPGMVGICIDFSQGELRIFCTLANELNMIQAYNDGIDMHMVTGAEAYGTTLEIAMELPKAEKKALRQNGKAGNFGLIYDISAKGFVIYARDTYGVHMTLQEAEDFQSRFFTKYPAVKTYHNTQKDYAKDNGFVRSPLGRVRHLPLIDATNSQARGTAQRQSINSPTQATLSDFGLMAMVEMDRRHPEFWFMGFVHDDLQAYVPEDNWKEWALELQDVMENLPLKETFNFEMPVTMQADIEMYEENMANINEYPDLKALTNAN